jgi:hypothetical protein
MNSRRDERRNHQDAKDAKITKINKGTNHRGTENNNFSVPLWLVHFVGANGVSDAPGLGDEEALEGVDGEAVGHACDVVGHKALHRLVAGVGLQFGR